MNHAVLSLTAAAVLVFGADPSAAQGVPRTVIAVDVSGSSTFLFDAQSAGAAAAWVEAYVAELEAPHELRLVSLGDAGLARRVIDVAAQVTDRRATSAMRLAPQFAGYLQALPGLAAAGQIEVQGTSSILGFLQSLEPVCGAGGATVVLFTDGIEWSSAVDGQAFIEGRASLPAPGHAFLTGCGVMMNGIGQVRGSFSSDGLEARLVPEWRAYLEAAGATPVTVTGAGFAF